MNWYEKGPFVIFDLETTGFSPVKEAIVEIAAIRIETDGNLRYLDSMVNPEKKIPPHASRIHGIHQKDVEKAPSFKDVGTKFLNFSEASTLVAHNAKFDLSFLQESLNKYNLPLWRGNTMDSIPIIKLAFPELPNYNLQFLRKYFDLVKKTDDQAHRALADAKWTLEIFAMAMQRLIDAEIQND